MGPEHFQGYENVLMPSFTPDLAALDEEGIRRDVRQSIAHGFFSSLCSVEAGLTFEEKKRFLEVAVDEAGGRISIAFSLAGDTLGENLALLEHAERVGCTHALLSYPHSFNPKSAKDVYDYASTLIDSANLGVYLFVSDKFGFGPLPSERRTVRGLRPARRPRQRDRDEARRLRLRHDLRVLRALRRHAPRRHPEPRPLPADLRHWGQQWSGAWTVEALQSPERPYAVEFFDLLRKGREDEAMQIYWSLAPALGTMARLMAPLVPTGAYHWPQLKYFQWLSGGNGDMTRQPTMRLFQRDLDAIKAASGRSGSSPHPTRTTRSSSAAPSPAPSRSRPRLTPEEPTNRWP